MKRVLFLIGLLLPASAWAHAVPDDVSVSFFLKPEGNHMRILARVPANAMIDILFPMKPGEFYIDLTQSDGALGDAARLWVSRLLTIYEGDERLPEPRIIEMRLSQATDPSFGTWSDALAHVTGPKLPVTAQLPLNRATLDVLLDDPIHSDRSDFSFLPRFARIGVRVTTTLTFLPPGGAARTFIYEADPEMFHLNPTWDETAAHFLQAGFLHIVKEGDHLLMLFCVVVLYRRFRALLPFTVAFSAAHTSALIVSSLNLIPAGLWFGPLIGTLAAIAIVYMGLESIVNGASARTRLTVAIASGVVFGYAFWFYLEPQMQYGGSHPAVAVLGFTAGIEMAQFLALALLVPAVGLVLKFVFTARAGTIVLAALAAHAAWHRMVGRAYALSRFSFQWPILDPAAGLPPAAMAALLVAIAAAGWSVFNWARQKRRMA